MRRSRSATFPPVRFQQGAEQRLRRLLHRGRRQRRPERVNASEGRGWRLKSTCCWSDAGRGWYLLRQKLEYKCQWHGHRFVTVPAQNTSITCGQCGYTDRANRRSQSGFHCPECGHAANADVNAARNIRRRGLEALASADDLAGRAAGAPFGSTSVRSSGTLLTQRELRSAPGNGAARGNVDQPITAG